MSAKCQECGCSVHPIRAKLYAYCIECNRSKVGKTYFLASNGFKNNGTSVMPMEAQREHMKTQYVRG